MGLSKDFWAFIKIGKKFWLLPVIIIFVLLSALIIFTETGALGKADSFGATLSDESSQQTVDEITAMNSPFGLLDPIIDTPTGNNFEYYKDLGIKWLSFSRENAFLGWQSIEKEKGKYDFYRHDDDICELSKLGINIIYVTRPINVLYGTSWVERNPSATKEYPEGHLKEWSDFVKAVVGRYKGDGVKGASCSKKINVKYYQLVSELIPAALGGDYWERNPKKYAEIFERTYEAMNKACADCILIMPVPPLPEMRSDDNFMAKVLANLDTKTIKNIGFDYHHWGNYKERLQYIDRIKEIASEYNLNPSDYKIISSESGTSSDGEREIYQAGYVIRSYVSSIAHGQTKQFWTRVFDYKGGGPFWMHIGLMNNPVNGGSSYKKLAYYTFKKMVEKLEGSNWKDIKIIQEKDGIYIYQFNKNGKLIWVAWNDNGDQREIYIDGVTANEAKVTEAVFKSRSGRNIASYNAAFKESYVNAKNGKVKIVLGENPVFIE